MTADLAFCLGTTLPFLFSTQWDLCYSQHRIVFQAYTLHYDPFVMHWASIP